MQILTKMVWHMLEKRNTCSILCHMTIEWQKLVYFFKIGRNEKNISALFPFEAFTSEYTALIGHNEKAQHLQQAPESNTAVLIPLMTSLNSECARVSREIFCMAVSRILYYYYCLLSQALSAWYISWTSGDPHRSGFKLHTAVLSVLCVMFQVQLSFVVNLSNVFLVQLPNFSLSFSLLFQWLQLLLV